MKLHLLEIPRLALQRRGSAVLGLIIIGIVWTGVMMMFRNDLQQDYLEVERRNQNYALLFEENVLRSIGEIDKAILYLRRSVEASKDTTDYQTIVRTTDVLSEIIVQVAIIDSKGIAQGSNAMQINPAKPIDISDREHFKVHVNSDTDMLFISKPLIGRASGKWSVQFTRRFSNQDGSFAGVVVASMDPAHFTSFYDKINLGASTSVAMIGREDGVVRSQGGGELKQLALGQDLSGTEMFRRLLSGRSRTFEVAGATPQDNLVVTARQVRGHPLWVTVSTKEQDIYKSAWSNLWQNVMIAMFLTALILVALEKILRAEARAAQKAQQLQLTLEHIGQGIMMVTKDREIPIINQRCADLLLLPQTMIDVPPKLDQLIKFKASDNLADVWVETGGRNNEAELSDKHASSIADYQRSDGAFIEVQKTWLPDGAFVQTFTDISKRRQAEAYIAKLASEDPLTSLHNRRVFRAKLQEFCETAAQSRFAILFMDMDRFKVVNDTIGHRTGDQLLVQVAGRLQQVLDPSAVLARLGGDEFAVLLPDIRSNADVEMVALRIIDTIAKTFEVDQHAISTGISIGIAIGPDHGKTADDLLVAADLALYSVKVGTRGTFKFFEKSMNDEVNDRREIELELRQALKDGTLEAYYQPIVDLQNNSIAGFEALARWPHPTKGMISPAKFIPVAEDSGLISALGNQILLDACRRAKQWPSHMRVSVNVSPIQLVSADIVSTVESVLMATGLEPHRLALEFTETIFIEDSDKTLSTLHKLKQIGVQIALDDFGTGYSSLSYLRSFPFDTVKIDRCFVSDLGASTSSNVIVQAIVLIAGGLGIKTVAEGIETDQQLEFLKLLGCKEVQGYLLGVPNADTTKVIEKWAAKSAAA